jgi:aryl-alcohol dehydrogenase-like predicted oxidoreductase
VRAADRRIALGLYRARPDRQLLADALDLGVTAIDTAYNYSGFGSHRLLRHVAGLLLDRFEITTKVGFFPDRHDLNPARLQAAIEETRRELGRCPHTVLIHNPENSPADFPAACIALWRMKATGLISAWGLSSWDPRRLIDTAHEVPTPDVLMLRAGLLVPSSILDAGQRMADAISPVQVWGMAPFGHRTTDPLWTTLDLTPFLPDRSATTIGGAFAIAYHLPPVARMAVGTTRADHLAQLANALTYDIDEAAVIRYRALIRRTAIV